MTPERAARTLANVGAALIALVLLLRVLSLTDIYAQSRRSVPSQNYKALPYLGSYSFSPSGAQVSFQQGWVPASPAGAKGRTDDFYMDLRTGQFTPGSLPPDDLSPFLLRNNQLWLSVSDGFTVTTGSPPDMRLDVNSLARSPDRSMMAFISWSTGGTLFVLSANDRLDTLIQAEVLSDPGWSPDGQALTFIMRHAGDQAAGAQVYRIQRDGTHLQQLTHGSFVPSRPRWSPDGKSVAYFQIPLNASQSGIQDIGIIDSDGTNQRVLTADGSAKRSMTWVAGTRQIAYTAPSKDWQSVEELYTINTDSEKPQPVRLYPPVTVEALECPKTLPRGGTGTVRITLQNSGPQPVAIPLVLRAGTKLIPLFNASPNPSPIGTSSSNQQTFALETPAPPIPEQRRQIIALDGLGETTGSGETVNSGEKVTRTGIQRILEWPASPAPGLVTHLSAIVLPNGQFPVSEKHCVVRNTYLSLPNLPYLPSILPFTIAGMLLAIPWLRHERKIYWWALWAAVPLVIAALIALEIHYLPPL